MVKYGTATKTFYWKQNVTYKLVVYSYSESIINGYTVSSNSTTEIGRGTNLTSFNVIIGVNSTYSTGSVVFKIIKVINGVETDITNIYEKGYMYVNNMTTRYPVSGTEVFDISYEEYKFTEAGSLYFNSNGRIDYTTYKWDSNVIYYNNKKIYLYYILNLEIFGDDFCEVIVGIGYD